MRTQFHLQLYPFLRHFDRFFIWFNKTVLVSFYQSNWGYVKSSIWKSFLFPDSCLHLGTQDQTPLHFARTLNVNRTLQDWNIWLARHKSFPKSLLLQILSFDDRNIQNLIRTEMGYFGLWWLIWIPRSLKIKSEKYQKFDRQHWIGKIKFWTKFLITVDDSHTKYCIKLFWK